MSVEYNHEAAPALYQTGYDRRACDLGVVHLGYGAFHRAHQSVFLDDYMENTGDLGWGIAAVNLRASDSGTFADAQQAHKGYLLKTTTPGGERSFRLVRAHLAFADWSQNSQAAEALLSRKTVHAVTITVTESGYCLDTAYNLNPDDPLIADEVAGRPGRSVYSYLANALAMRAEATGQPVTILCCDNIRANGAMLQRNFLEYLSFTQRHDLAAWVQSHVRFPCSMVDRITPRANTALLDEVEMLFPGQKRSPVHAEAFTQWVLEQTFAGPMPDLSKVGVQLVADVDAYEETKIRVLNGGHTGLCYLGALAGYTTFDQAMRDPVLRAHFDNWERNEVLPGLDMCLPFEKRDYLDAIAARFGNAAIADQLERICMDGWSKMPIMIRPTLASCLSQGIVPIHGFQCVASWYVYARRFAAGAMPIPYREPYWDALRPLLVKGQEEVFARTETLWGELPERHDAFVPGITAAIHEMERQWPA